MLRVLLTNDDGIGAAGLQTLRRALVALDDVELATIAPDSNRSATARSITFSRPLWVTEVEFDDKTLGYACDGTPVDCVRLASLGLIDGFQPDLIVSGINHGSNLGDDITYSGTVAAALEGVVLGHPGDRGLAAVAGPRDGLPARRAVRLHGRRGVRRADRGPARRRAAARGHAAQRQRAGRRARGASRSRGWASGSTATSCRSSRRRTAAGASASTATRRCTTTRRGPTSRPSPPGGSRSRRCTST